MSFTNPGFLWALFAMLIPVVIHLINFRKPKVIYFSNTAFIEDIKKETRTKTKLKQILILIARMLTIAMLVIVFAGPYIPNANKAGTEQTDLAILYIDNSFSMDADAARGKVFELAKQLAKDFVFSNPPSMNYVFLSNDKSSDFRATLNRDQIITSIDECAITANSMSINELIIKANSYARNGKRATIYAISDMQKYMFDGIETQLNDNVNIVFMSLNPMKINNLYIDSCWFETPVHRIGQNELLKVRITNKSAEGFYDIPLQLYINGSLKAMSSFNVEQGESVEVDIEYRNNVSGNISARLEISDYPIVYDNIFYFSYVVSESTKILSINANDESEYLKALFGNDNENFKFQQVKQGYEAEVEIETFDLVILNSVSEISSGLGEKLKTFVNNGGSVCLFPSQTADYTSLNRFLKYFAIGKFDGGATQNIKLGEIDYNNSLYKNVFSKEEKQSNLPNIEYAHKISLYSKSGFSPVLKLENSASVLLAGNYGNGKLYVFATPIININTDFAKSVAFAPAMYNMAMNSQIINQLYATINAGTIVSTRIDNYTAGNVFKLSDKKGEIGIVDVRYNSGMLNVFLPDNINNSGIYNLSVNEDTVSKIALNYNRKESMQDYLGSDELNKIVTEKFDGRAQIFKFENVEQLSDNFNQISEGKTLWKYFVMLAMLFILIEITLIKFMK